MQMTANLLDLPHEPNEAVELAPPFLQRAGPHDAIPSAQEIQGPCVQPERCLHSAGEISWGLPELRTTVSLSDYFDGRA